MRREQAPHSRQRIEFLDFAKGFAILSVVLYHCLQASVTGVAAKAIMLGGAGVHVFIVLSGFGLALSPLSRSAVAFYRRRLARLLIPYYAFLTILLVVNHWFVIYPGDGLYAYLGRVFFFGIFDESITHAFGYPLWFISVIVQLYLLFPILLSARDSIGNVAFVASALLLSGIYWGAIILLDATHDDRMAHCAAQYLWEFCAGMALARAYASHGYCFWEHRTSVLLPTAIAGIGLLGISGTLGGVVLTTLNDVPSAVGCICAVALVFKAATRFMPALLKVLEYLGRISLELYLVHVPIVVAAVKIAGSGAEKKVSLLLSILIVPIAAGSAVLFAVVSRWASRTVLALRQSAD